MSNNLPGYEVAPEMLGPDVVLYQGRGMGVDWIVAQDIVVPRKTIIGPMQPRVIVRDLTVLARTHGDAGLGIVDDYDNERHGPGNEITRVAFMGNNPGHADYHHRNLDMIGCWNDMLTDIYVRGAENQTLGRAVTFTNSVDCHLVRPHMLFVNRGVTVEGKSEGIRIDTPVMPKVNYGVRFDQDPGGYKQVDHQIIGGHIHAIYRGVRSQGNYQTLNLGTSFYRHPEANPAEAWVAIHLLDGDDHTISVPRFIDTLPAGNDHGVVLNNVNGTTTTGATGGTMALTLWDQTAGNNEFLGNVGTLRRGP